MQYLSLCTIHPQAIRFLCTPPLVSIPGTAHTTMVNHRSTSGTHQTRLAPKHANQLHPVSPHHLHSQPTHQSYISASPPQPTHPYTQNLYPSSMQSFCCFEMSPIVLPDPVFAMYSSLQMCAKIGRAHV